MYTGLHVKDSLFFSDFNPLNAELNPICHLLALLRGHPILHIGTIRVNQTSTSSTYFHETPSTSSFMKIRPMGTDLFHGTETQTDMAKLIVAFHKFCESANGWNNTSTSSYVRSRQSLQQGLQFRHQNPKKIPKPGRHSFDKCTI